MIRPERCSNCSSLPCSKHSSSKLLDEYIGHQQQRLQLKEQHIVLGHHDLCLIEPADVDAVIDMYIAAGMRLVQEMHAADIIGDSSTVHALYCCLRRKRAPLMMLSLNASNNVLFRPHACHVSCLFCSLCISYRSGPNMRLEA